MFTKGMGCALVALGVGTAVAQVAAETTVRGHYGGRDGYSDVAVTRIGSTDYALVADRTGLGVVDLSFPGGGEVSHITLPASSARTIAVFETDIAYVADLDGGMLSIVNLASPGAPVLSVSSLLTTAADLSIDEAGSRLIATGTERGLVVADLTNPEAPSELGSSNDIPANDSVFRNGVIYASTGDALAVFDVTGLPNLSLLAWVPFTDADARAIAVSDDNRFAVLGNGSASRDLITFDASLVQSIAPIGEAIDAASTVQDVTVSDWNVYVAAGGGGLSVWDVSDWATPLRIFTFSNTGATGESDDVVAVADPTPDGDVVFLDRTGGVYRVSVVPEVAVIEGTLIDSSTSAGAGQVTVAIVEARRSVVTGSDGFFRFRVAPGTYTVTFDRLEFERSENTVTVDPQQSVDLGRTLTRLPAGTVSGIISLAAGSAPQHPEGTIVRVLGTSRFVPAGFSGFYIFVGLPAGDYVLEADRFGYDPVQFPITVIADQAVTQNATLSPVPFADNLETDEGWTFGAVGDDATGGAWEIARPIGTGAGYIQPKEDETPNLGTDALVTANGLEGDWIDDNDVDGGTASVISPVYDLTSITLPILRYYRWFQNTSNWEGSSFDGDRLGIDVSADRGATWRNLDATREPTDFWDEVTYVLPGDIAASTQARFRFTVSDLGTPSIVDDALDDFEIFEGKGLLVLPTDDATPIDWASVDVRSIAPGTVIVTWWASGAFDRFRVERTAGGATTLVAEVDANEPPPYRVVDRTAPAGRTALYSVIGLGPGGTEEAGPFPVLVQSAGGRAAISHAPNPASPSTTFRYVVPDGRPLPITLDLFDVAGRRVRRLVSETEPPGTHRAAWDGRDGRGHDVAAGTYFFRLRVGVEEIRRTIAVVR
jgi:hypothetical protein